MSQPVGPQANITLSKNRMRIIIATISASIGAVGIIVATLISTVLPRFLIAPSTSNTPYSSISIPASSPVVPPTTFAVTTQPGQILQRTDAPVTLWGTYSSDGSGPVGQVWVVLEDSLGQFYLQNPEVEFQGNGKWIATNIRIGTDIAIINFVYVTTDAPFQQKVEAHDFAAFSPLPPEHKILSQINL